MQLFPIAYASVDSFVENATDMIVVPIIKFLLALAFVLFMYGVVQYVINPEQQEKRTEGKQHMLWAIIGLTIMLSIWGVLNIAINTFGLSEEVNVNDQPSGDVSDDLGDVDNTIDPPPPPNINGGAEDLPDSPIDTPFGTD